VVDDREHIYYKLMDGLDDDEDPHSILNVFPLNPETRLGLDGFYTGNQPRYGMFEGCYTKRLTPYDGVLHPTDLTFLYSRKSCIDFIEKNCMHPNFAKPSKPFHIISDNIFIHETIVPIILAHIMHHCLKAYWSVSNSFGRELWNSFLFNVDAATHEIFAIKWFPRHKYIVPTVQPAENPRVAQMRNVKPKFISSAPTVIGTRSFDIFQSETEVDMDTTEESTCDHILPEHPMQINETPEKLILSVLEGSSNYETTQQFLGCSPVINICEKCTETVEISGSESVTVEEEFSMDVDCPTNDESVSVPSIVVGVECNVFPFCAKQKYFPDPLFDDSDSDFSAATEPIVSKSDLRTGELPPRSASITCANRRHPFDHNMRSQTPLVS
jgi:hypothetical protein